MGPESIKWSDIKVCPDSIKNICSGGVLRDMGYELFLMRIPRVVYLYDGAEVLIVIYSENGIPYVDLHELLNLTNMNQDSEVNQLDDMMISDDMQVNRLELLHQRCGHVSKCKLLEAHRHMLFCGSGLTRQHLSRRYMMKSELSTYVNPVQRRRLLEDLFVQLTQRFLKQIRL